MVEIVAVTDGVRNSDGARAAVEVPSETCFMQRSLLSQIATSNLRQGCGGRRKLPYAFTEHGALMAASVRPVACMVGPSYP